MGIKSRFGKEILIFDGAMGTMLQESGLKLGELPETLNISDPEKIISIHKKYIDSGANIISTNTFGANEIKLGDSPFNVEELIESGVENARKARGDAVNVYIALDIGPTGELLEPMGTLSFERAYYIYKRQVLQGVKSGVDLILFETMTDLYEVKAAVLAAKENSNLPVFCTMSFEKDFRTFTGANLESMVLVLEGLGLDALGLNCSLGPKELEPLVAKLSDISSTPIIVQANAGIPKVKASKTVFDFPPKEFSRYGLRFAKKGAWIIGGCCGTNNHHIKTLKESLEGIKPREINVKNRAGVCTPTKLVMFDKVRVVGEIINPTGKELLKKALLDGDMDYIIKLAIEQEMAGADILDINVGIPGINEKEVMAKVVKSIQSVVDIPLQIDSSDPEVIEAALRIYNGTAIVNSVDGKEESLDLILPIIKKYGGMVIGLTLDESGIPKNSSERLKIASNIVKKAGTYGINRNHIIIDSLVLTAASQQDEVIETVETLSKVKKTLGVKTTLGISNVSFGLPNRGLINKTFLSVALFAGLDMPIVDPLDKTIMDTINASRLLWNEDIGAKNYLETYKSKSKDLNVKNKKLSGNDDLTSIIIKGLKEEAKKSTRKLLEKNQPLDIVNMHIIPALDLVGGKYKSGQIFLPQLIRSAETVNESFEIIREKILETSSENISNGSIVLATVYGDIHDIGKNIVKVLLQSYNYQVYDLGRDVPIEEIVNIVLEKDIKLVGLSALMTTTVKSMENTIKKLKEEKQDIKIIVGGAVLNEDYARKIGADYYANDAKEAVDIAKKVLS